MSVFFQGLRVQSPARSVSGVSTRGFGEEVALRISVRVAKQGLWGSLGFRGLGGAALQTSPLLRVLGARMPLFAEFRVGSCF